MIAAFEMGVSVLGRLAVQSLCCLLTLSRDLLVGLRRILFLRRLSTELANSLPQSPRNLARHHLLLLLEQPLQILLVLLDVFLLFLVLLLRLEALLLQVSQRYLTTRGALIAVRKYRNKAKER